MPKGLSVQVYKPDFGDCSNGGFSSFYDNAILVGPDIPEIFEPSDKAGVVELTLGPVGQLIAVPAEAGDGCGPMFGGCFIYTSDSRFPSDAPIKLFDRYETAEDQRMYST